MRFKLLRFEFNIPELESEYRQFYLRSDINQVITGMFIWLIPSIGFIFIDYRLLGGGQTFNLLLALRLTYIALTVFVIFLLARRVTQAEDFDRLVFTWGAISLLSLAVIGQNRLGLQETNYLVDLVAVFSFYVFIPNRLYIRIIPPLVFSLYVILVAAFTSHASTFLVTNSVFFTFTITNVIGVIFSVRYFSLRRKEFLSRKEENRVRSELQRLASTDSLTGALNRRRLIELAGEAFYRFTRYQRPFSILLMDLDGFKRVNDTFGHMEGDKTLIAFSEMIAKEKREIDILGRMGGDEFCLVLPETLPEEAATVSERILKQCGQIPVNGGGLDVRVSVSIGITQAMPGDQNLDAIFARADSALYLAKESGRNRMFIL